MSEPSTPTPGELARFFRRPKRTVGYNSRETGGAVDLSALEELLRTHHPNLSWLLGQIGIDSQSTVLDQWANDIGGGNVQALLANLMSTQGIIDAWCHHLQDDQTGGRVFNPIALLILERTLSLQAPQVAPQLPASMKWDKTLHVCRQHVGTTLYDHAREVNWHRPFIYSRGLRLAREYFRSVVSSEDLTSTGAQYQFLGKLGVATALISQFEQVSVDELTEAAEALYRSMEVGNPVDDAMPYFLEVLVRTYDVTGDRGYLKRAVETASASTADRSLPGAVNINLAEAWLRLAELAETSAGRAQFLEKARCELSVARRSKEVDFVDTIRVVVLDALVTTIRSFFEVTWPSNVRLRGLKTPFGLAEHITQLSTDVGCSGPIIDALLDKLRLLVRRNTAPLGRRTLADVLSAIGAEETLQQEKRVSLLYEAMDVRQGGTHTTDLHDEPSRLRQAADLFALASLAGRIDLRKRGVKELLDEAVNAELSCNPLVLLAVEIERRGPVPLDEELASTGSREWREAITRGDSRALYEDAAIRAIQSNDVRRRHLGGRSNVLTTEDHLGMSSETFVFKQTTRDCKDRDRERTDWLSDCIVARGLQPRFGLIEHIADVVLSTNGDSDEREPADLLTVRRFRKGEVLAERCNRDLSLAHEVIANAAEFLALIHACESARGELPQSIRRRLKDRDLGRWLKVVVEPEDRLRLFDVWWGEVKDLPVFPRRDAHAYNWLVTSDEQILAIDLEAAGWCPAGYELAQLTDDVPVLGVSNAEWAKRKEIVESYRLALARNGIKLAPDALYRGYVNSLLARAVRSLSDPAGDARLRAHAENLLSYIIGKQIPNGGLVAWAEQVLEACVARRGGTMEYVSSRPAETRRRRVSRALAFHLRHDKDVVTDELGWVTANVLAERLGASGLNITSDELVAVAGSIDEARFESKGQCVRARYGHSIPVIIDYEPYSSVPELFHMTTVEGLNSIFQHREGLVPMGRQWVHLSSDWRTAVKAARRKVGPVLLEVSASADGVCPLMFAGGSTWLTGPVPSECVSVVPVSDLFCWEFRFGVDVVRGLGT